jgi:HAD superfamily hydrolase (TIGR01450 family)
VAFITNNAAREPAEVAARLARLGVAAAPGKIVTSAVAAAALLASELAPAAPVLVVGGPGLSGAVAAAGLSVVHSADDAPVAVVQGWGPDVGWHELAEATLAVRAGARWVATNRDRTLPSPRGPLPGAGALIAAVSVATGRDPDIVVGKPGPALFTTAVARTGGRHPLVVGDRLDTDIAGAAGAGLDALLVLSGISRPADVLAAPPGSRPAYLGAGLDAIRASHPAVTVASESATCRDTTMRRDGSVRCSPGRAGAADPLDGLRAAAALAWAGLLDPRLFDRALEGLDLH